MDDFEFVPIEPAAKLVGAPIDFGNTIGAMAYFAYLKKSLGSLWKKYQEATGAQYSKRLGIRTASYVAHVSKHEPLQLLVEGLRTSVRPALVDQMFYDVLKANLLVTGLPQLIMAEYPDGSRRLFTAYRVAGGEVFVAHPHKPGDGTRSVRFSNGSFGSLPDPDSSQPSKWVGVVSIGLWLDMQAIATEKTEPFGLYNLRTNGNWQDFAAGGADGMKWNFSQPVDERVGVLMLETDNVGPQSRVAWLDWKWIRVKKGELDVRPASPTGAVDDELTFGVTANGPEAKPHKFVWDFGDQTVPQSSDSGASVKHKYQAEGTFPIKVEMRRLSDQKVLAVTTVTVTIAPPVYTAWKVTQLTASVVNDTRGINNGDACSKFLGNHEPGTPGYEAGYDFVWNAFRADSAFYWNMQAGTGNPGAIAFLARDVVPGPPMPASVGREQQHAHSRRPCLCPGILREVPAGRHYPLRPGDRLELAHLDQRVWASTGARSHVRIRRELQWRRGDWDHHDDLSAPEKLCRQSRGGLGVQDDLHSAADQVAQEETSRWTPGGRPPDVIPSVARDPSPRVGRASGRPGPSGRQVRRGE